MTVEELIRRSKSLELPVTKNAFSGTIDEPVPPLPYMIYLIPHEKGRGADNFNNLKETDFDLELYTAADDEEREKLAKKIETEILFDVEYEKYVVQIDNEECFQTAYEVKGIISKVKGRKDG